MSDEVHHQMRRGRALRTTLARRSHEARARANSRRGAANANRKREKVEMDWDAAIARLRVMLDDLDRKRK